MIPSWLREARTSLLIGLGTFTFLILSYGLVEGLNPVGVVAIATLYLVAGLAILRSDVAERRLEQLREPDRGETEGGP